MSARSRAALHPDDGSCANNVAISSRSRKRVSGGATRLGGIAATRSATASISGARRARYSKKVCNRAKRWLRVRA